MPKLYNAETRKPEDLDGDDYVNAIGSGTHSFKAGEKVNFFDPEGNPVNLPAEKAMEAVKAGYKPVTPTDQAIEDYKEENSGLKGTLKVGLTQLADEAALGLPELIYQKTADPLQVAKWNALKKEHDAANIVGGITGGVGSLLLGGPLFKGAAKAGEKTAALVADKLAVEAGKEVATRGVKEIAKNVLAKAAGGAVEGTVLSMPHAITEAALGDPEDAAETILSGIGIGSLLGGGSVLGKELFTKVSQKVAGSETAAKAIDSAEGMRNFFKGKAEDKAVEALNPILSQRERLENSKDIKKLGRFLIDEEVVTPLASKKDIFDRLVKKTDDYGKEIGAKLKEFDDAILQGKSELMISPKTLAESIKSEVEAKFGHLDAYKPSLKNFNAQLEDMAANPTMWTIGEANQQKSAWGDIIKTWGMDKTAEKKLAENIYKGINKEIESKVELGFGKDALQEFKDLKTKYGYLEEAEKIAQKSAAREARNNDFGLTGYVLTGAGAVTGGAPGAAAAILGREITRKYGDQILSATYDKMAGLLFAEKAMKRAATKFDRIPELLKGMSDKIKIPARTMGTDAIIRVMSKEGEREKPREMTIQERIKKLEELNGKTSTLVSNPFGLSNQMMTLTGPLIKGGAPQIGAALGQKMTGALNYLNDQMPKPPKPKNAFSRKVTWQPSDYDLSKFEQKLNVVEDPFIVLDELARGTLTSSHVDALKNVYPGLYRMLSEKVSVAAASQEVPMDYSQRMKLSLALGVNLDDSTSPRSVAYYQSTFTRPDQTGSGASGEVEGAPGFKADVNVTEGMQTNVDRVANRNA